MSKRINPNAPLTLERNSFYAMHQRCRNPKNDAYKNYGGRGIMVCERWRRFENFYADMGERPSPDYSLERKDNNKGYCPDNCLWATRPAQSRNMRNNKFYTLDGQSKLLCDWAREFNISQEVLRYRIRKGWRLEDALKTPVNQYIRNTNGEQMSKRIVFTFDERSFSSLEKAKEFGRFDSYADTVRTSLIIFLGLQDQYQQGYTELVVRNPENGKERVLAVPLMMD